jgi:hypothetical protein
MIYESSLSDPTTALIHACKKGCGEIVEMLKVASFSKFKPWSTQPDEYDRSIFAMPGYLLDTRIAGR